MALPYRTRTRQYVTAASWLRVPCRRQRKVFSCDEGFSKRFTEKSSNAWRSSRKCCRGVTFQLSGGARGCLRGRHSPPYGSWLARVGVHIAQSISDVRGGESAGCGMQRRLAAGSTDKLCSGIPKKNKYCASVPRARIPASDNRG